MKPLLRRFTLTVHIASSVGLLGAITGFLALAAAGLTSPGWQTVRAAYLAMDVTARMVIVPLAFAALLTGVIQSLGTHWGLFRHYWVVAKLLLTSVATIVLLVKVQLIRDTAALAAEPSSIIPAIREAGTELAFHAGAGLLVLLVPLVLSVYKPPGLTRYGMRKKQHRRRGGSKSVEHEPKSTQEREVSIGRSYWLKVIAILFFVLAFLFGTLHLCT